MSTKEPGVQRTALVTRIAGQDVSYLAVALEPFIEMIVYPDLKRWGGG